jgi:signal peptidase I
VLSSTVRWRSAASIALQIALLALIAFALMLRAPQVSGPSMEPRVDSGEYVLINTLAYRFGAPRRGEIIAFKHEENGPLVFLKRVIGIPGDHISIVRGYVSRNGRVLDERYVRYRDGRSVPEAVVPAGAYYVLGDNRANSEDSRAWGFVRAHDIVGRALWGIWPFDRLGAL